MIRERTPACSDNFSFRRPEVFTTYGAFLNTEEQHTAKPARCQPRDNTPIIHGRRSKHDKKNLLKPFFGKHKRRWHSLEETSRRLLKREKDRAYLPAMAPLLHHKAEYHDNGTLKKKSRKRPTQRIESMVNLLLPWLLHTFNLTSNACGHYANLEDGNRHFLYYNYSYFVTKTGLTLNRIKRCMRVLIAEGICDVSSIFEEDAYGNVKTTKVIIRLTNTIFQIMGTERAYLEDLEKAARVFRKEEDAAVGRMTRLKVAQANMRSMEPSQKSSGSLGNIISQVSSILPYKQNSSLTSTRSAHVPDTRREAAQAAAIKKNPYQDPRVLSAAVELQNDTRVEVSPGKWEKPDLRDCLKQVCLKFGYDPPY